MYRTLAFLLTAFCLVLTAGQPTIAAQSLTVDQFFKGLSPHSKGDKTEHDLVREVDTALNTSSYDEAQRALPVIFDQLRQRDDRAARFYAEEFLLGIAIRPDRAALLDHWTASIAALLTDTDEAIQIPALSIIYFAAGSHPEAYLPALKSAIQMPNQSQDTELKIVDALVVLGPKDKEGVQIAVKFIERDDLTPKTWRALVHDLGVNQGPPDEICTKLVKALDHPDPTVRAAAIVAFAGSSSPVYELAHPRIERMAFDDKNKQIRQLAKDALSGQWPLNPNIDPETPKEMK